MDGGMVRTWCRAGLMVLMRASVQATAEDHADAPGQDDEGEAVGMLAIVLATMNMMGPDTRMGHCVTHHACTVPEPAAPEPEAATPEVEIIEPAPEDRGAMEPEAESPPRCVRVLLPVGRKARNK
jgi:hypothetical protein